jgi:hypothetical protein
MFINAIATFRSKSSDSILAIYEDAPSDLNYEICCNFLDLYANDDSEEIHTLEDYITYGTNGDGYVNAKLLKILAALCSKYDNTTSTIVNNKSYCNSNLTMFERAESYWLG